MQQLWQQQQPIRKEGVQSISTEVATWESRTGVRDETKNATEVEMATGSSERTASRSQWTRSCYLKNEANTQEIARVTFVSNKICIREDLAEDKMVFTEDSSRSIIEMGNAELIELKKSSIQCPSCLHHVFEGTFIYVWKK